MIYIASHAVVILRRIERVADRHRSWSRRGGAPEEIMAQRIHRSLVRLVAWLIERTTRATTRDALPDAWRVTLATPCFGLPS